MSHPWLRESKEPLTLSWFCPREILKCWHFNASPTPYCKCGTSPPKIIIYVCPACGLNRRQGEESYSYYTCDCKQVWSTALLPTKTLYSGYQLDPLSEAYWGSRDFSSNYGWDSYLQQWMARWACFPSAFAFRDAQKRCWELYRLRLRSENGTLYFKEMQRATILYLHCLLDEVVCNSIRAKIDVKLKAIESAEKLRFQEENEWSLEWTNSDGSVDLQHFMKQNMMLQSVIQQKTKELISYSMCINTLFLDVHRGSGNKRFYLIMALHFFTSLPTSLVDLVIAYADVVDNCIVINFEQTVRDLLQFCQ
jgi:hypothetical protein